MNEARRDRMVEQFNFASSMLTSALFRTGWIYGQERYQRRKWISRSSRLWRWYVVLTPEQLVVISSVADSLRPTPSFLLPSHSYI